MAGIVTPMQLKPVDQYQDLFAVHDVFPDSLVQAILKTDWLNLPWQRQEGQELWARRRINDDALPWISEWSNFCQQLWPQLSALLGMPLLAYQGTAWWLDEPGFTCALHTDGEMPGAMQISWIGALPDLGTAFYHYKNSQSLRHQFEMKSNSGYIMINSAQNQGFRHLQWHGMLTAVPPNTFRLSSYSWITPTT